MPNFSVEDTLLKARSFSRKGDFFKSLELYQNVLELFPNNIRAKVGLSKLKTSKFIDFSVPNQKVMNQIIELYNQRLFEQVFFKILVLIKDFPHSYVLWNMLGITCMSSNRLEQAKDGFTKSIQLNSNFVDGHNNLGLVFLRYCKFQEAVECFKTAVHLNPDYTEAFYNMGIALENIKFERPNNDLQFYILQLLDKEIYVRPSAISGSIISLIKCNPNINIFFKTDFNNEFSQLQIQMVEELSNQSLLIKLMSLLPIPDLEIELFLTKIRYFILFNILKVLNMPDILKFQTALALQCFINEYLYKESDEETKLIEGLENSIQLTLLNNKEIDPIKILCLASYRPLHIYSWCNLISLPKQSEIIIKSQINNYILEKKLSSEMPVVEQINDLVSYKVRQQYEESPYPKWVNVGLHLKPFTINKLVEVIELKLVNKKITSVISPDILIAGCGTGEHSLNTASRFKDSNILAVDLSLRSLAYAQRRTNELGIKNIKYMQSDILNLKKIDKQFDIIESCGVLHHMEKPMAGWKVLVDCLKTGGLMNIALYSEIGREHIVNMRNKIEQFDLTAEETKMKLFRNYIINSEPDYNREILLASSDFYSLSAFRDLLFHVEEHRFTLIQIRDCLHELGLEFCGFEKNEITSDFKLKNFGENDQYDLKKWGEYEKLNPQTFKNMYQFWCQKVK